MDAYTMAGIAVITAILAITVKQYKPELGIQVSIAGGAVLMLFAITELSGVMDSIRQAINSYNLDGDWVKLVVRVLGIAYIAQLASQICRDSGEGALAIKVELCGRLMILSAALPSLLKLLDILTGMIGETL